MDEGVGAGNVAHDVCYGLLRLYGIVFFFPSRERRKEKKIF